jgi:hypothetical protein
MRRRFSAVLLPGVFPYQNKTFVASQLFGVLRKYYPINIHEILKFKNVFATLRYGTGEVENRLYRI